MMCKEQQLQVLTGTAASGTRRIRSYNHPELIKEEGQSLAIVNFSCMTLDSLPHNPSLDLAYICKLDLSNNHLQKIPESLAAGLLNVVVLDVHSNQLKSLPNSIECMSKLKILNVSGNLLQSFPKTIQACRSLEELNANFNRLTALPDTMGFEFAKLRKLSVNSNKLMYLPSSTPHLSNLRTLDARLNCLRSLPDDLENLFNLEKLNISQNFHYLTTLPFSIGLLISLVELDVSYNRITALPDSMGYLKKLQKLIVEGNPLISPPIEVLENGLHMTKVYLAEKMNGDHQNSSNKKGSWFAKLRKCHTFNGARMPKRDVADGEGLIIPNYRPIDGLASPRYMGMFSPRRLFSTKTHFSR